MKRIIKWVLALTSMALLLSQIGCRNKPDNNGSGEFYMREYYAIEDFESISIGNSSFKDVYEIAPIDSVQITSYGGFCEYPTKNGGCIRIKFQGKELTVISIEEENNISAWADPEKQK